MKLDFETDEGAGAGGAIGLIVLETDETLEPEIASLIPPGVALYHARIPFAPEVTPETLARMAEDLPRAAGLLPKRPYGAIGYGCTSGATVIGAARVAALIRGAHPGVGVADPMTATVEACAALGVGRLGFVTPYLPVVSAALRGVLEAAGLEIAAFGAFEEEKDAVVARITEASTLKAILKVGAAPDVEAVFVACTNIRGFGIIEEAEAQLGKPVMTSNLAFCWRLLSLAGVAPASRAPGRLFRQAPPGATT